MKEVEKQLITKVIPPRPRNLYAFERQPLLDYDLGQHRIISTYKQNHPAKC